MQSLLLIKTVALYTPSGEAKKVTVKVVLPLGATVAGKVMPPTVKFAALAPPIVIVFTVKGIEPLFWIV